TQPGDDPVHPPVLCRSDFPGLHRALRGRGPHGADPDRDRRDEAAVRPGGRRAQLRAPVAGLGGCPRRPRRPQAGGRASMKAMIGIIRRLFDVLPPGSRKFLGLYGLSMAVLSLMDVGALGALALALPGLIDPTRAVTIPVIGWVVD